MHHKPSFLLFPSISQWAQTIFMFRAQIFSISGIFHLNWGDNQSITEFYHTVKDDDQTFCCRGGSALAQQEPLKGFTRFSFYSWQMDQKILRNHWDPFEAFFVIKKSVWRDLQNCCVLYRRCLLKRASKTKFSKYLSILMYGTVQNDSWNASTVFHFKVFCHKKNSSHVQIEVF